MAATIATYAAFLGFWVENYEPIAWAEELIEPACVVDHPRPAFLYLIASQCWMAGRIEAAVRYAQAGQVVSVDAFDAVPYGIQGMLGGAYMAKAAPAVSHKRSHSRQSLASA